ncbi:MAG: hypothetical protein ACON4A_09000 [Flavobacteriaceae bacterium]
MKFRRLIFLAFLLGFYTVANAQQSGQTERILFIGNSFTFYWNIPKTVELMAHDRGLQWDVDQATLGGASLEQHWKGLRGLTSKAQLEKGNYDRVILQDYSSNPLKKPENTKTHIQAFQNLALPKTPRWYYYSTWMYPNIDTRAHSKTYPIEAFYQTIQKAYGGEILTVGKVFARFQAAHPDIKLLTYDQKHTSPEGSYLAACVIFAQLSGQNPLGLPNRFMERDENTQLDTFYTIVQKKTAQTIQEFVAQQMGWSE